MTTANCNRRTQRTLWLTTTRKLSLSFTFSPSTERFHESSKGGRGRCQPVVIFM
jgi:hypothetical protein